MKLDERQEQDRGKSEVEKKAYMYTLLYLPPISSELSHFPPLTLKTPAREQIIFQ